MKKIMIINGPNLNLLGIREPTVYGHQSFDEYLNELRETFNDVTLEYYQSNIEGEIITCLQQVGFDYDGVVLNAGGYTHTSVAIHDAIAAITSPVVEVHISNIYSREEYRRHSLLSDVCCSVICGMGLDGYRYAVDYLIKRHGNKK